MAADAKTHLDLSRSDIAFIRYGYLGNIRLENSNIDEILMLENAWQLIPSDLILWMSFLIFLIICINFFITAAVLSVLRGISPMTYIQEKFRLFPAYLILMILKYLAIGLGLMLFIIPGVVIMLGLYFAEYLLIDKEIPITESLKKSWEITRGFRPGIFLFEVNVFIISYLLSFPQMIWPGTTITYIILALINIVWLPVAWNAAGHIYRFVSENPIVKP
ncbi:MAG: YciC family protein [Candidatus Marinimicrobia bacterium]|nr:YciC family protein [Candidatus Neomarinimicrobiota bacterium]